MKESFLYIRIAGFRNQYQTTMKKALPTYVFVAFLMMITSLTVTAQNQIRTFTYHQITKLTETHVIGQDWQHVLSDDGNKIVWFKQNVPKKVFVMNPDGSGMQEIVDLGSDRLTHVDISADGSKVVYVGGPGPDGHHINFINSNGSGDLDLVGFSTLHVNALKICGNGTKIFFNLIANSSILGGGGSVEKGVYSINPDGTGLTHLVGPSAVATVLGINAGDVGAFYGASSGACVDVSYDGSRIVFVAGGSGEYHVFTADGGGNNVTLIHSATYIGSVGISKDGEKIAFTTTVSGGNREGWVANFDGSSKLRLASNDSIYFTNGNSQGDQVCLTANGSQVMFDGAAAHLYNSDGSGVLQLGLPPIGTAGNPLIIADLARATMSTNGSSVLYSFREPGSGLSQLAMLYSGPTSLGASPDISQLTVIPGAIAISPQTASTLTTKVSYANGNDSLRYVGNSALKNGVGDTKVVYRTFYDDGVSAGDVTANDQIYTHNNVFAYSDAVPGPRTLRFNAEIVDASGFIHGTAIDVEPFYVVSDTTFLSINELDAQPSAQFSLEQNYPNPFNSSTRIQVNLSENVKLNLGVYDALGKLQATLINKEMGSGSYEVTWNGSNADGEKLGSGVYFIRMQAGNYVAAKRMLLAR